MKSKPLNKAKRKQELIDAHYELSMTIALSSVRINELQKALNREVEDLLKVEVELGMLEAEELSGLN